MQLFPCIAIAIAIAIAGSINASAKSVRDGWEEPYFQEAEGVEKTGNDLKFTLKFDEISEEFLVGTFAYTGGESIDLFGRSASYFQIANQIELKLIKPVDFEKAEERSLDIYTTQGSVKIEFTIEVQNVNDNLLFIFGSGCEQNENNMPPTENTGCSYTISDADGISKDLEFSFSQPDRFKMSKNPEDIVGLESTELFLTFLKKEDFETEITIPLTWKAWDESYVDGKAEELLIVVTIKDQPDMPPIWQETIGSILLEEETGFEKELKAKDGDIGEDWTDIEYRILECNELEICANILIENSKMLTIAPIILDDPTKNSVTFKVIAKEVEVPNEEAEQVIFLQIQDINNHKPEIKLSTEQVTIEEQSLGNLDITISINDKDSGSYATYDVELSSVALPNIKEILQIIPSQGYQQSTFSITIIDANKLDYDYDQLDSPDIDVKITAKDPINEDEKTFTLTLTDKNESPSWKEEAYTVEIPERYGFNCDDPERTITIANFFATDPDKEPEFNQLTYKLLGSGEQMLTLIEDPNDASKLTLEAKCETTQRQIFDFEREPTVVVSIEASDGLIQAMTQLTITLTPVNDEKPTLVADAQTAEIKEQDVTQQIEIHLTGEDVDSGHELVYGINEDPAKTYMTKLGRKITWADNKCITIDANTGELTLNQATDYAKYDTIYLQVYVRDMKADEAHSPQDTELRLIITIENIPNLPLEFVEDTFLNNVVVEKSDSETFIGVITAIDNDVPNSQTILYTLIEKSGTASGLIKIDEHTGRMTVAGTINADKSEGNPNGLENLEYTVIATAKDEDDDEFERSTSPKDLLITIKDVNDNPPTPERASYLDFEVEECDGSLQVFDNVPACEKTFEFIKITDIDRDLTNREFSCQLRGDNIGFYEIVKTEESNKKQKIKLQRSYNNSTKEDDNQPGCTIKVRTGAVIDREIGLDTHSFEMRIIPNNDEEVLVPIAIKIIDINDNPPSVEANLVFTTNENHEIDAPIDIIRGVDRDIDEKQAKITFELKEVRRKSKISVGTVGTDANDPDLDTFEINEVTDIRNGELILKKSLRNLFGEFELILSAENSHPESLPTLPPTENQIVTLVVEKYNYEDVTFTLENQDPPTFVLLKDGVEANKPLELRVGGTLQNIKATDNQGDKYEINFEFVDDNHNVIDHPFFKLSTNGVSDPNTERQLQLKTTENWQDSHTLILSANAIGANPSREPAITTIRIQFVGAADPPTFEKNDADCEWNEEETGSLGSLGCTLPVATPFRRGIKEDDGEINYIIVESAPVGAYEIPDPTKNEVNVIKGIDLWQLHEDGHENAYFKVETYYSNNGPTPPNESVNENSLLTVTLKIKDINNHPPQIKDKDSNADSFLDVLMIGSTVKGSKLDITFIAEDKDVDDTFKFRVDYDTYVAEGVDLPPEGDSPFTPRPVNANEIDLTVEFQVLASMTGRITFDVVVENNEDAVGHANEDRATLDLYVISESHLCPFIFENNLIVVQNNEKLIKDILQEVFEQKVGIKVIQSTASTFASVFEGETGEYTNTEVVAYFIDEEAKVGITNDVIKGQMNNIAFYGKLRAKFLENNLLMKNVIIPAEAESLEDTYKIALIVVSVILGLLLIAVIAFFTYRIRSTNNRLDRLDQAEVKRPTVIRNLPGANRRPTQVMNPNISQIEEDTISNDLSFTQSPRQSRRYSLDGDDDEDDDENFVGVENNEIFKISSKF